MKQETLEEVAKEIFKEEHLCNGIDIAPAWREGFVTGAKYQQEQDEKMYSEEEVLHIIDIFLSEYRNSLTNKTDFYPALMFEQFKNK
jgi:hypothetical protein